MRYPYRYLSTHKINTKSNMNIRFILIMAIATMCTVACKKGETDDPKTDEPKTINISGNYSGYMVANCKYFKDKYSANETIVISNNNDGTVNIALDSKIWGVINISNAQVNEKMGTCSITGNGTANMGMGEKKSSYKCTCKAVVYTKEKAEAEFLIPDVMGGLTIKFKTGEAKADLLLADTYFGYTDANCSFFQHFYTDNEKLVATAKGDGTLSIFFDSATWGKFEVSSAAIAKKDDKEYTFYGVGEVAMSMMGAMAGMYGFEMLGTVSATKENYSIYIKVPAVMGGLTIVLLPGKAPKQNTGEQLQLKG